MTQPTPYNRQTNFFGFGLPSRGGFGAELDAEFNAIEDTLDRTLENLALIQRDDGKLADGCVTAASLDDAAINAIAARATAEGITLPIAMTDVTGLATALDGRQPAGSYAAAAHAHSIAHVTGLEAALDGKQPVGSYAAEAHSHLIANVAGLQAALDAKQPAGSYAASKVSDYFAFRAMLKEMREGSTTVRTRLGRFADVFTDGTGINAGASSYYDLDVRKVVGTQRTFASTVAPEENFDDITDWTTNVGVTVVNPGDPDPMVGMVAEMNTGATAGNQSVLRKLFGTIPASFGVSVLMGMKTSNASAAEATEFQIQNNQGHQLKARVYTGAIQAFYDGAWRTMFAYGGTTSTLTEWWLQVTHNSASNYTVRLFAGTQELPGFTGNLPGGTPGEDGWVGFIQYSSTVANRKAHLAFLQVGSSALPPGMTLVSTAQATNTEPTQISLALLVEDTCLATRANTDVQVEVSKNGGTAYSTVTLTDMGEVGVGILDTTKPIYLFAGTIVLPANGGSSVSVRIKSFNERYFSLLGHAWKVDA